jgi:DNA-binding MarR family transcriptional regulator
MTGEQPDAVEWMRLRWAEHQAPQPEHFAAMASLLRTAIVLTEEIDRVLKASQLSRTGYLIIITLQMSREQTRPLGQLSKALLVHPTTITMAIDQLEKAGLVRRVPHPSDRRTIFDISAATASRITADLRTVRQALGDLG